MKNIFLILCFFTISISAFSQKNTLLDAEFWKKNPDVVAVKAEIAKGNNPAELNANAFDPVVLAINNSAPNATILYLLQQEGNPITKITHDSRIYLHWATYKGNTEIMEYLLSKGSDINLEDSHGNPPAAFAAASGQDNTAAYDLLFKKGIDPKKKYKDGANLLHLGIQNDKDLILAKYFMSKGLSLNDVDNAGNTAFDYAARGGNVAQLKNLVAQGVKYTPHALFTAAQALRRQTNTIDVFKYLVDDLKINPTSKNANGETVLHLIVRKNKQMDIINYFMEKGVDINTADKDGNTVLMNAVGTNEVDVVEKLISATKNINASNSKGKTVLTFAFAASNQEIINLLLTKEADPKVTDKSGNNLSYYLIDSYKPNSDKDGNDPFSYKLNLLKEKNIDLSAAQNDGNTLYHLALAKNDVELLKKLAPYKININHKNNEGMTVLHKAALVAKDDKVLKYLVESGAKKDLTTEFDETAYMLAGENETLTKNNVSIEFLK